VNLADLALLYGIAGLGCAVAIYRSSTDSRPRAAAAAALAVPLWPLWAPIALTSRRAVFQAQAWGAEARAKGARSPACDAAAKIDAALREGVDACAGTSLESLLPRDAAARISAEVARAAARHAELTTILERPEFDLAAAERRVSELTRAVAAAPDATPPRALLTARLHGENVKRLSALRARDALALEDLADLVQALRTQLVLARFAGSSVEGAGGIVSEVWARVEGLGAAMGADDSRSLDQRPLTEGPLPGRR
jgi:hypothetical protein